MAETVETGALTSSKVITRRYVKYGTDDSGKTVITATRILSETDKKEPEKLKDGTPNPQAGMSVNWATAENEGFTLFSENEFIQYDVTSFEGAEALSPDPAIRLYIYRTGLANVQTARSQAAMKALKENTAEPEAEFNQATIDLRTGTDDEGNYSLNKAPARRSKTDLEKLQSLLDSLGLSPEDKAKLLLSMASSMSATNEVGEEEQVEA